MRTWIVLLLVLLTGTLSATEEIFAFDDAATRQLFDELTEELRCPKCQNQNIADSNALVAQDLKRKVYELLQQGYDKQQVIDYMKSRYGDFVYYRPPLTPATLLLWLAPLLFVLAAAGLLIRRRAVEPATGEEELLAKAERWLEDDK